MSLEYLRTWYQVPAKRGGKVRLGLGFGEGLDGQCGRITGATHHLRVRMDDGRRVWLHPTWRVTYL